MSPTQSHKWSPSPLAVLLIVLFLPAPLAPGSASAAAGDGGAPIDSSADLPIDFTGYRIPAQNWRSWFANATGSTQASDQSVGFTTYRNRGGAGNVTAGADFGYDSDPLRHDWGFRIGSTGDAQSAQSNQNMYSPTSYTLVEDRSDRRDLNETWLLDGSIRSYPWDKPIGIQGAIAASGNYGQSWRHVGQSLDTRGAGSHVQTWTANDGSSRDYRYLVTGELGAGLGRVRDASMVYRVWVFERRLLRDGTLSRPLTPAARSRLAELFSVQWGYSIPHQFPDKAFWAEVEQLLRADGALTDDRMSAYGMFHVLDPLVASGAAYDTREVGWFAGPFLQGIHEHVIQTQDMSFSSTSIFDDTLTTTVATTGSNHDDVSNDRMFAGLEGEYHRPIGAGWQIDAFVRTSADVKGLDRYQATSTEAKLRYRFAERWVASFGGLQQRVLAHGDSPIDMWRIGVVGGLEYQLEDHWRLSLSMTDTQVSDGSSFARLLAAVLGVSWSWGRFDAPGLIAPVRPLPAGLP